jgi:hypothetical protein
MPIEGPEVEKVHGVGSIVAGVVQGMEEPWPELVDVTSVIAIMRHGGLTPSDPGPAVEWLAFNAFVHRVGEQMGY